MFTPIRTGRLLIRPFITDDAAGLAARRNDPMVVAGSPPVMVVDSTIAPVQAAVARRRATPTARTIER